MRGNFVPRLERRLGRQHPIVQRVRRWVQPARFGTLRRTTPLSSEWGTDRGTPIDRYYIERFLDKNREDIRGRVLEIKDSTYTDRYGRDVERSDVLDIDATNQRATVVADLSAADCVESDQFDCFILTQTLQLIPDTRAALRHAYRILKPGGVLLVTVPSISRIVPRYGLEHDYWRFTHASCSMLFEETFGTDNVETVSYGSVLSAISFLAGIAREELKGEELDAIDPYFPVIIAVRATKRPACRESTAMEHGPT